MPLPGPTDTVDAKLTPGEHVMNREAVALIGADKLAAANREGLKMRQQTQGYQDGGLVQPFSQIGATSNPQLESIQQSNTNRSASAASFGLKTGYTPGQALGGNPGFNPVSNKGSELTSPTNMGTNIPGVQRNGNSFSGGTGVKPIPQISTTTGVQSAVGSVTQPAQNGILRGMGSLKPVSFSGYQPANNSTQGYASGTLDPEGVQPNYKKIINQATGVDKGSVRPSVPLPAAKASAQVPGTGVVPAGARTSAPIKEPVAVKPGFFTEPKPTGPGFTTQPTYEGSIAPNKSLVTQAAKASGPTIDPYTGQPVGPSKLGGAFARGGSLAKNVAKNVVRGAASAEALPAVADALNTNYLEGQMQKGNTGMGAGLSLLKYAATRAPSMIASAVSGQKAPTSLDTSAVRKMLPSSAAEPQATTQTPVAPTPKPSRVASVVQEPKPAAPTSNVTRGFKPSVLGTGEQKDTLSFPGGYVQAGSDTKKGGIFGKKSTPESMDALSKTLEYNARPETKAMFAREAAIANERWDRYKAQQAGDVAAAQQAEQARAQAEQLAELQDIALNGGPSGDMTPGEFAQARHRQEAAKGILANRMSQQQRQQELGLEGKRIELGEKQAKATQEAASAEKQYQRSKDEDAVRREEQRMAFEREKEANKPVRHTINGETFYGTKQEAEALQKEADKASYGAKWAEANSQGLMEGDKAYQIRQKAAMLKQFKPTDENGNPVEYKIDDETGAVYTRGPDGKPVLIEEGL